LIRLVLPCVGLVEVRRGPILVAYHESTDSYLVDDVARSKYPPSWVRTKDLWNDMNTIHSHASKTRRYLILKSWRVSTTGITIPPG
jgi:hypothetical protein